MAKYPAFGTVPPMRTGAARRRTPGAQARNADQDVSYTTKYSCSSHLVTYYVLEGRPALCPVCDQEDQIDQMRQAVLELTGKLEVAHNALNRLAPQVDLSAAIRAALGVVGDDDFVWLKTQMYQYKLDKSVTLKVTHGRVAGGKKIRRKVQPANGFIAIPRRGEPEGYLCTSMGGLAIAGYFDEAIHTLGSAQAMGLMLKAMWQYLPGAVT